MKPSNLQTPRTLADCTFTQGYTTVQPMAHRIPAWENWAGYILAGVIGFALAALLIVELSK